MSQIHFIGGEKGGVGKSCVTRLLAQYFVDNNYPFTVRDGDQSHAEMLRFYADYSEPVDLEDGDDMDRVFEAALESDQRVLVDLPSQSERLVKRWIDESGIIDLAAQEAVPLIFWHVMDDGKNSVDLLHRLLDNYAGAASVRFVVVKNLGRGIDFSYFEKSATRTYAEQAGTRFISLGELNRKVMNKIDRMNLSFWAASHLDRGECLNKMERQRVRVWMTRWSNELQNVSDLIHPRPTAEIVELKPAQATGNESSLPFDAQAMES